MPRHRRRSSLAAGSFLVLVVATLVAACGGSKIPVATFDPSTPCTTDGRQPGAYPELEAALPKAYEGRAPVSVDSGRNCTTSALGTLADEGISGVHFAGATWDLGGTTALTVALFEAGGLDAQAMFRFYQDGARRNSKTEKLATSELTVGGAKAYRLDVLQSDGTGQTVVAWPAMEPGRVHVLLAADLGDAKVLEALAVFGAG